MYHTILDNRWDNCLTSEFSQVEIQIALFRRLARGLRWRRHCYFYFVMVEDGRLQCHHQNPDRPQLPPLPLLEGSSRRNHRLVRREIITININGTLDSVRLSCFTRPRGSTYLQRYDTCCIQVRTRASVVKRRHQNRCPGTDSVLQLQVKILFCRTNPRTAGSSANVLLRNGF